MDTQGSGLPAVLGDDRLATLALISLPQLGPARYRWLCSNRAPSVAWEELARGEFPDGPAPPRLSMKLAEKWMNEARKTDPAELGRVYAAADVSLLFPSDPEWPFTLDPDPPPVLFYRGSLEALGSDRRVAVVGTRQCSSIGRLVARALGRDLSWAGVAVVSGLALGIDGEVHTGVLGPGGGPAMPIGVVGSGLDHVYPKSHRALWAEVSERGLLLSEAPLGAGPQRWRFPARNRLLAGLCDLVVVVESHMKGGSLLTVESALDRGVGVAAIPGSTLAPSCEGSNQLLVDGALPVRGASDVLAHLGLDHSPVANQPELPLLDSAQACILDQVLAGGGHMDRLLRESELPAPEVMEAVQALISHGVVRMDGSTVLVNEGWVRPEVGYPHSQ